MRYLAQSLAVMTQLLVPLVAEAQTNSTTRTNHPQAVVDPCKPIGRTEDGKLVYGMSCSSIAAHPSSETTTEAKPQPEIVRSGIFGFSYGQR